MSITRRGLIACLPAFLLFPGLPGVAAAERVGRGSFRGASGHSTKGNVTVTKTGSGYSVRLESDFVHDGAPDPWLGFGRNGRFLRRSRFARLRSNTGAQNYAVPRSAGSQDFNEVYVWCRKYGVPLGVARIR